jgi:hypothetical protein
LKEIKLTQGQVALVDDEDWKFLRQYNWYAKRIERLFYAVRALPRVGGKKKHEHMHRVVLARKLGRDISPGMMPDHEDGNGLNNQRENLSEKTRRGNGENRHVAKTSKYLGVSWCKEYGKWRAQIWVNRKCISLGSHNTELAAALAREDYISAYPELNATTNFIKKMLMESRSSKLDQDEECLIASKPL